ncbi:CTP synthase [Corynebacterium kozikiae]|uniref:CTP synthase n=1 Tax=Corynebacterium kozikiae TaxID=2968469 RepID=UPI00211C1051|nr:CTP synthase [Corynebacterium sp. 76QC2CO]MCQ9343934.1 CTP synthase [Corynebacterium sp. 76QC2CO]
MDTKYIFVTGGVLSGVGKGITAASIGAVLQAQGLSVSIQKCDPYLNVDAGLLNPREHGECFVTKDGAETDLDLGHYERFLDIELTQANATLSGRLMLELLQKERAGGFGGKTVQLVPHLTGAIQDAIVAAGQGNDVHIVEIGGTVGDYEGLSFIEAIREFSGKVGRKHCMFVHVVYVPFIETSKEFKTKPAQNALSDLRGFGIVPDAVIVRSENPAPESVASKIALFGGVAPEAVLLMPNVDSVFRIPTRVAQSPLKGLLDEFTGHTNAPAMDKWEDLVQRQLSTPSTEISIAVVAKYLENEDAYLSVVEALKAAAWQENTKLNIEWLDAEHLDTSTKSPLAKADGVLVPGGFGARGVEGKIAAATFALDHQKPYLGLCLGMQAAVIAAARRGGLEHANSSEFTPDQDQNVIYLMEGQDGLESTGGTLRLGDFPAVLTPGSKTAEVYGSEQVVERHRHRYEVNQAFTEAIQNGGLIISGTSPDGSLVEFVEAPASPFFVATQAHPEFRSRPFRAHPLFVGLVQAALAQKAG